MSLSHEQSTARMSMIVRHNDTIYLSGQTADASTLDVAGQTRICLEKIEALLAEAGSDRDRIISALVHIEDLVHFDEMNRVWDAWVADHSKPARTCIEARIARPEALVEITIVAAAKV